jgi:hypothetical protein
MSKARVDLPEPETPVTTVSWWCAMESERFLRLFSRAPVMVRWAGAEGGELERGEGSRGFAAASSRGSERLPIGLHNSAAPSLEL